MSDTKKTPPPSSSIQKGVLSDIQGEEQNFEWRQRVEHFFNASKKQYEKLHPEHVMKTLGAVAVATGTSVLLLSEKSQTLLASLFAAF